MKPRECLAQQMDITTASCRVKESGRGRFSDREKVQIAKLLELTPLQLNDGLYDGLLPIWAFSSGPGCTSAIESGRNRYDTDSIDVGGGYENRNACYEGLWQSAV